MKNILDKLEKDETQFFIMKSFVTATFETDITRSEYHIFFIKKNSSPDAYYEDYTDLKIRKMNRMEVQHLRNNLQKYTEVLRNNDGTIFNLKTKPFDKDLCPKNRQLCLNL